MKSVSYLIRLDDACPTMDKRKWNRIEEILDKYTIKPMVGIIPNNQDSSLYLDEYDEVFTNTVKIWQKKGWCIALHGYDHCCRSLQSGINPVHNRSEFAGLDIQEQREKISLGLTWFSDIGMDIRYFFAPSHTFDLNTIEALKTKSNIRIISDTIAFNPYKRFGMVFIPQQFGRFRVINMPGTWTFCYHHNTMNENVITHFGHFIEKYKKRFISFQEIDLDTIKDSTLKDMVYQKVYFLFRKLKYHQGN